MKEQNMIKDDEGSVLVIALIILLLLTLVGLSTQRTSSIEIQISGNDRIYKRNLFMAEASAMDAAQILENTDLEDHPPTWISPTSIDAMVRTEAFWSPGSTITGESTIVEKDKEKIRYVAVHNGLVTTGESLDVSKTKLHDYTVYGRSNLTNGIGIIELGYRKAY
jgi:type IV pilus assembly protein PilX